MSLLMLLGTTILQFAIFLTSGSVALLASTIHNFSHALIVVHALPSLDDLSIRAVTATAPTNTKSLPTVPSELPAIPRHAIHLRNRSRLSQWMLLDE
ncbi:hypothetical protein [Cryobacterium algoritolerans]|uniref:hypothetical protein n=1 Tax=Cryobacterium algoritolerans TaxID=1259184 RepID=UPI0030BA07A4